MNAEGTGGKTGMKKKKPRRIPGAVRMKGPAAIHAAGPMLSRINGRA